VLSHLSRIGTGALALRQGAGGLTPAIKCL
jgi:hypothetical protein